MKVWFRNNPTCVFFKIELFSFKVSIHLINVKELILCYIKILFYLFYYILNKNI